MRLLLDTHVFLWCIKNDRRLTKEARNRISSAVEVYVSSASIWEAIIKIQLKKLEANVEQMIKAVSASGFLELPIKIQHAAAVSRLPDFHRDPFDRILIAQATVEPLTLLTADSQLKNYSDFIELI